MQKQESHSQAAILGLQHLIGHVFGINFGADHDRGSFGLQRSSADLPHLYRYLHVWGSDLPASAVQ